MNYLNKYLKYKEKYLTLKNQIGGRSWKDQEFSQLLYYYRENKDDTLPGTFYIQSNIKWSDLKKLNEKHGKKIFQETVHYDWADRPESTAETYQNKVLILEEVNKELFESLKKAREYLLKPKEFIYNSKLRPFLTSTTQDQQKQLNIHNQNLENEMNKLMLEINKKSKRILFSANYKLVGTINLTSNDLKESIDKGYIIVDIPKALEVVEFDKDVDKDLPEIIEKLIKEKWVLPILDKGNFKILL